MTERVRERLVEELSRSLRGTLLADRPDASDEDLRTAGEFIAGGVLGVLLGWLEDARGRSDAPSRPTRSSTSCRPG